MLSDDELAAIRARCEATPEGDWHPVLGSGYIAMTGISCARADGSQVFIADVLPPPYVEDSDESWRYRVPLLNFITASRTDVPALLADAAAARRIIGALRAFADRCERDMREANE